MALPNMVLVFKTSQGYGSPDGSEMQKYSFISSDGYVLKCHVLNYDFL